jgi:coniferyl-aldehyde dehydrogenase
MHPTRPPDLTVRIEQQREADCDPAPLLDENEPAIVHAIDADFGGRSAHETRLA